MKFVSHQWINGLAALSIVLTFVMPKTANGNSVSCDKSLSIPMVDPNRKYNLNFKVPERLIRITKIQPDHLILDDGNVRNHSYLSAHSGGPYARTVPMIDPMDLPIILNLFKVTEMIDSFFVLVIDPNKVLHLTNAQHSRLPENGEFFGEVPEDAVMEIVQLKEYLSRIK